MDASTRELFEEIAHIRGMVPSDSVNGLISRERWQQRWKKVKEDTSSSKSGLHFGHYIAGTDCDYISQFHALRVSLALKKGIALERWSKGLSVMLEKMFGVRLVSKLRAILLMEADFNAMNKEVYGVRMMDNARRYKLIPEEIFSEQNRTADDGGLAKTLFYDIARQTRTPAAIPPPVLSFAAGPPPRGPRRRLPSVPCPLQAGGRPGWSPYPGLPWPP